MPPDDLSDRLRAALEPETEPEPSEPSPDTPLEQLRGRPRGRRSRDRVLLRLQNPRDDPAERQAADGDPFSARREALGSKPRRPDQEHVFAGKRGQRLSATTHFHLWNPVRAAAGKLELDWHHLRHVAGSLMAERGLSTQDIAFQLGHADGGRLAQRL